MKKILVVGIIVLFVGVSVSTSIGKIDTSKTIMNDGSLLGYVKDTSANPIEGALVRVYFHETFEEDYSDEDGVYHVTNIPICYCLKNATCSKDGYKTEWVLLSIVENTTYDFVLTSGNHAPEAPTIRGKCIIREPGPYDYKFKAKDPDGDDIRYYIDWGDGSFEVTDYNASGEEVIVTHTWNHICTPLVVAYAVDIHGAIGPKGYLDWRSKSTEDTTSTPDEIYENTDCDVIGFSRDTSTWSYFTPCKGPVMYEGDITFGYEIIYLLDCSANGWIYTQSDSSEWTYKGSFRGDGLGKHSDWSPEYPGEEREHFIGIKGFKGLAFGGGRFMICFYIGHADTVRIIT